MYVRAFKNCVECIDLSSQSLVDAEWLAYLGAFKYLCSLNVSDCHRITSSALWPLSGIYSLFLWLLQSIRLYLLTDVHTGLASLREINLSRCAKVTDTGIMYLSTLPTLRKLWISQTGLTSRGITVLSKLHNLALLDLGGLPVTDEVLSSLQVASYNLLLAIINDDSFWS